MRISGTISSETGRLYTSTKAIVYKKDVYNGKRRMLSITHDEDYVMEIDKKKVSVAKLFSFNNYSYFCRKIG